MVWVMHLWWNPGSMEKRQQSQSLFIQHSLKSTLRRHKWRWKNRKQGHLGKGTVVLGKLSGDTFRALQISIWLNETAREGNVFEMATFYAFTGHLLFWPISLPQPKRVMVLLVSIQGPKLPLSHNVLLLLLLLNNGIIWPSELVTSNQDNPALWPK